MRNDEDEADWNDYLWLVWRLFTLPTRKKTGVSSWGAEGLDSVMVGEGWEDEKAGGTAGDGRDSACHWVQGKVGENDWDTATSHIG